MTTLTCKTRNLAEKVIFEQQETAVLKREIFGSDKKPCSKYIREFTDEFRTFERISDYGELLEEARAAKIVYVGDFHAAPSCQEFQGRLLERLAGRPVVLAVEMLYGRNQSALDDWMAGKIDDVQLRRRVRFDLEWGYSWDAYVQVLKTARRLGMRVFGVDCGPRNDLRMIGRRDRAVAAKLVALLHRFPGHTLVVSFGESHMARNHLPAKVAAHFPPDARPRTLTILQNLDEVYWQLSCDGIESESVVRLCERHYCVFNASPIQKYESYRRQLEIWHTHDRGDEGLDLTSTVYSLIRILASFIRVDPYAYCLYRDEICLELLVDAYPEVYAVDEFEVFEALLHTGGLGKRDVQEILTHTLQQGSCYVPKVNAIFIGRFDLTHAAEEAAHFVNFALKRQRHQEYRRDHLDRADAFYLSVLEEALGYFGSKLIDPRRDQLSDSPVLNYRRADGRTVRSLGLDGRDLRWMRSFVLAHKQLERGYDRMARVPRIILKGLKSRGRVFRLLAHELGYLLGEQLYLGYVTGEFSRREISRLFAVRFEEDGRPLELYLQLAARAPQLALRRADARFAGSGTPETASQNQSGAPSGRARPFRALPVPPNSRT